MRNSKIQKKLLRFIADYNDGKISFLDPTREKMDSKKIRGGVGKLEDIGCALELKFIDKQEIDDREFYRDEINKNLRLLAEDNAIKITPGENDYLKTKKPIFLTSLGYRRLSIFYIFKKYPLEAGLGSVVSVVTILDGIKPAFFVIKQVAVYIYNFLRIT